MRAVWFPTWRPRARPWVTRARALWLALAVVAVAACTGQVAPGARESSGTTTGPMGGGGGSPMGGTPSPAGVIAPASGQRLTDRQYVNVIADLFAIDVTADTVSMPIDPKVEGFRNAASALQPSDVRIEGYATLAGALASKVDWPKQIARDGGCTDFSSACENVFVATVGRRLFRRPLDDEQRARFQAIFDLVKGQGDPFTVAAGLVVQGMLQSPEFLYRLERTTSHTDDYEAATRLAFLLWNSGPDDVLLDAAGHGELGTAAGLHGQVTRLLNDDRARRALRDYVDDWLDTAKLPSTSRDSDLFPAFTPALALDMREEVQRLFARVLWTKDGDMLDVLRAQTTEVTAALAKLYGLPAPAAPGFSEVSLADLPGRYGLLSQAGILTVTSVGSAGSSIVDRGVFVLRNVLCQDLPEPPVGVPQLADIDKGASERDRLAQHRTDPSCGSCHGLIDPVGVAFETFDGIGAYQTTDSRGNKLTGVGMLNVAGQDLPFNDFRQFVEALLKEPSLPSCLARKVLQYSSSRPLAAGDAAAVDALVGRFNQGGRHYRDLLAAVAESAWSRVPGAVSP
jgi:hypothetical protein